MSPIVQEQVRHSHQNYTGNLVIMHPTYTTERSRSKIFLFAFIFYVIYKESGDMKTPSIQTLACKQGQHIE